MENTIAGIRSRVLRGKEQRGVKEEKPVLVLSSGIPKS